MLILSRLFSHTLPVSGQRNIIRVEQYHLALQHYSGGQPVPRAASLSDGGLHKHASECANVRFFSSLLALLLPFLTQQTGSLGVSDHRPVKDSAVQPLRQGREFH